jgi:hypothetical protein
MNNLKYFICLSALSLCLVSSAFACYPCSLFNVSKLQGVESSKFSFSINDSYSSYDKAQDLDYKENRDGEFVRDYNLAQLGLSYGLSDAVSLDFYLPVINRNSDQVEGLRVSSEKDSGVGDMILGSSLDIYSPSGDNWFFKSTGILGIKLPTGDSGTLGSSINESSTQTRHHPASGSSASGRNLVFGTGSVDFIMGLGTFATYEKFLFLGTLQYTAKTEGDYDYKFADDFLWSAGSGYYLSIEDKHTLALAAILSGEQKSKDSIGSELVQGSQFSNLFLGPSLLITLQNRLGAELGFDFRVTGEDVDSVVVPEWRLKAQLSYNF